MSFLDILNIVKEYAGPATIIGFILMCIIQITPIKINPWSKLFSFIGRALTKDVSKEISDLKKDISEINDTVNTLESNIEDLDSKVNASYIVGCRARIIRFGDEVSHGIPHSRNHFQMTMNDITHYNQYCATHPTFLNNMTKLTVERIEEDYKERDRTGDFL